MAARGVVLKIPKGCRGVDRVHIHENSKGYTGSSTRYVIRGYGKYADERASGGGKINDYDRTK